MKPKNKDWLESSFVYAVITILCVIGLIVGSVLMRKALGL